ELAVRDGEVHVVDCQRPVRETLGHAVELDRGHRALAPGSEYRRTMFSPLVAAWLEFERALADAQAELGVIPVEAAREIGDAAVPEHVDLASLRERTLVVGYPILPLLEQIVRRSPAAGRYLHRGATTQDVIDTGLALVTARALDRIESLARTLGDGLATLA